MELTGPNNYTDVSQENFDRFKLLAKARGLNISGNKDDVVFDTIPVHVEYNPDAKVLTFGVHEPHWLAPGVTLGALHQMVATAMDKAAVIPAAAPNGKASTVPAAVAAKHGEPLKAAHSSR